MAVMTSDDYKDILDLIYLANSCQDIEYFTERFLPRMSTVFSSEVITFHLIRGVRNNIKVTETKGIYSDGYSSGEAKHYLDLYNDYFYQYSPLLQKAISTPETVLNSSNSISRRDWEMSDFYNNFIVPQHLYWELFLALRNGKNFEGMITLWRSHNQPEYNEDEAFKAEMLSTHLAIAINNMRIMSKITRGRKDLLRTHNPEGESIVILDHKLKPSYLNNKAWEICSSITGRIDDADSSDMEKPLLPSCIIEDCRELLSLLKVTNQPVLLPKERIMFARGNRRFRIKCSLIWKTSELSSTPNFLITLNDISENQNSDVYLRARFHLSKREVEIICCIISGMSYTDISEKLCISRLTVHSHVKNIYRKTGARNRIELDKFIQMPI